MPVCSIWDRAGWHAFSHAELLEFTGENSFDKAYSLIEEIFGEDVVPF